MIRRALFVPLALAASACSPAFDVDFGWTVNGEDAATTCEFLPDGVAVRVTALSRDNADPRFSGEPRETTTDLSCDAGSGTINVGSFAAVRADLVVGDDIFGSSPVVNISPGRTDGRPDADEPTTVDIQLTRGTLTATLTVVGESCGDAGVASFTADLLVAVEPRTNVLVEGGIAVPCKDGVATFTYSPVDVGSRYFVTATAPGFVTIDGGEGIDVTAANTFFTVDLQAE